MTCPGWQLDAYGTWTWDEPSLLERAGVGVGALRHGFADRAAPDRTAGLRETWGLEPLSAVPAARTAEPDVTATPIFQALSEDRRSRRSDPDGVPDGGHAPEGYGHRWAAAVPEPHPGSGPLPIQDHDGTGRARRGLADVPTVPPPVAGDAGHQAVESPEDELRRRAERRRRPWTEPEATPAAPAGGGRHAMPEPRATNGRHAMR